MTRVPHSRSSAKVPRLPGSPTAALLGEGLSLAAQMQLELITIDPDVFRDLFITLPIGVALTDPRGRIVESNPACERILGIPADELERHGLPGRRWQVIWPDGTPMPRKDFPGVRALKETRAIENFEMGLVLSSTEVRWINVTAVPLQLAPHGIALVFNDLTERKRLEEEAKQQQYQLAHISRLNSMGEMATALAHELSQPLAAIANYLSGSLRRIYQHEQKDPALEGALLLARQQTERAGMIIEHIKRFTRKHVPHKTPLDINQVIREVIGFINLDIKRWGVTVRSALATNLPPVPADKIEIEQVLINLMRNGIEAMQRERPERRILVLLTNLRPDGRVEVVVNDWGAGVKPEDMAKIFNPFFTTKSEGTGFGLAICTTIVESHDGELTVSSEVGEGCTFRMILPAG